MPHSIRIHSGHPDFIELVKQLDAELADRDGDQHDFYHQFNGIDDIKYAAVFYHLGTPIGCGAIKEFDNDSAEVKRMYVLPENRGKGVARVILRDLEEWAKELGFKKTILETGKGQPEAIALYEKSNYQSIPNYGQYAGVENSVCFQKILK